MSQHRENSHTFIALSHTKKACGAVQPPIELLRQFMDMGGWYGRDNSFRAMTDVQFVAAMGTPGGGRTFITDRYLRHFNLVALSQVRHHCVLASVLWTVDGSQECECIQALHAATAGHDHAVHGPPIRACRVAMMQMTWLLLVSVRCVVLPLAGIMII